MRKKMKKVSALILTASLLCSAFVLPEVYASIGVETDKNDCVIEVSVGETSYKELSGSDSNVKSYPVKVDLYKVGDVSVTGKYTPVDALKAVGGFAEELKEVSSKTSTEEWLNMAEAAKKAVEDMTPSASKEASAAQAASFTGLGVGLYLVDVQTTVSDYYEYTFTPYLISLPNNYYSETNQDDTWVYELTGSKAIGLKPEKSDRYGDLVIQKTLDVYNATNPNATFVFQVEASKTDVDTGETKVVYSDVVSMAFTEVGTKEILIEKIPAGADVTVTEVYSGASYVVKSDDMDTAVIKADAKYDKEASEEATVEAEVVEFSNTHNGIPHGGSGVINNFKFEDGTWNWEKIDPKDIGTSANQGEE